MPPQRRLLRNVWMPCATCPSGCKGCLYVRCRRHIFIDTLSFLKREHRWSCLAWFAPYASRHPVDHAPLAVDNEGFREGCSFSHTASAKARRLWHTEQNVLHTESKHSPFQSSYHAIRHHHLRSKPEPLTRCRRKLHHVKADQALNIAINPYGSSL